MTPEEILSRPARVLSARQREAYFTDGYIMVEKLIPEEWLDRLRAVTAEFVEQSRTVSESGAVFDLAPGHDAARPMIRRVKEPDTRHDTYWEFATALIADVAADLVGPDVVFHHSKLNFKWPSTGNGVQWHQDIQFYPTPTTAR